MIIKNHSLVIPKSLVHPSIKYNFAYLDSDGNPFCTYDEDDDNLYLPNESLSKLKALGYDFDVVDKTPDINYPLEFKGTLRSDQEETINKFFSTGQIQSGILQAKCGFGKTVAVIAMLARMQKTTIILVHTKLLLYQWIKELQKFTDLSDIGIVGDGQCIIRPITVALYKSALNRINQLQDKFTIEVVDEVHRAPADLYSTILMSINTKYKIGVSATPRRQDGKHVMLPDHFGLLKIVGKDIRNLVKPRVEIMITDIPYVILNPTRDRARALNQLFNRPELLNLIDYKARKKISNGRCPLILGERVEFLRNLSERNKHIALLIGQTKDREEILTNVGNKYFGIASTTIFDEGVSCDRLDTLFSTAPTRNFLLYEQRVGRIEREHDEKQDPLIVDFWYRGSYVEKIQMQKWLWYVSKGFKIEKNVF